MKKSAYFLIQVIWSLIISTLVVYFTLKNASFDFYHNSDDTLSGMIFFFGTGLYLILTLVYLVIGYKTVKEWHWWIILISIAIAGLTAFSSLYVVAYGTEFLNRTFNLGLFILH